MPAAPRHLRVFLSSPGDLGDERAHARRILRDVERGAAWRGKFTFEAISWDDPDAPVPMDAHLTPQRAVDRHLGLPSQCDLVVVMLWSRLGTPLEAAGVGYRSGTEYELAEALAAEPGPRVLIYRRDDEPPSGANAQWAAVRAFAGELVTAGRSLVGFRGADAFARRFRKDLQGVLRELEDSPAGGPALELRTYPVDASSHLQYRARAVALAGREREMKALHAFLADEAPFSWWAVAGGGGAGKSRIGLELALAVKGRWRAGFLPASEGFERWHDWRPDRPTLVIVDYVVQRADAVRSMLLALCERSWRAGMPPLRVLLLERQAGPGEPWWDRLVGTGSQALALRAALHASPLVLASLDDDAVWSLVAQVLDDAGVAPPPARSEVLESLDRIDAERRPLFVLMAADALASGRDLRHWDRDRLLEDHLAREEERFWRPAGVEDRDRNLLALATLVGGIDVAWLRSLPEDEHLPGAAPGPRRFDARRYQAFTGVPSGKTLAPLKPDIVGEYFVLRWLQPHDAIDDRAGRLWALACRLYPMGAFSALENCTHDFPRHPTLALLGGFDAGDPLQCFVAIVDLWFRQTALAEQQGIDKAIERYRQLAAAAEHHRTEQILNALDVLRFDYVKLLGEHGCISEAEAIARQLLESESANEDTAAEDEDPLSTSAELAYNLATFHCQAGDANGAQPWLALLRDLLARDGASAEVRQQHLVAATNNVIFVFGEQGALEAALEEWCQLEESFRARGAGAARIDERLKGIKQVVAVAVGKRRFDTVVLALSHLARWALVEREQALLAGEARRVALGLAELTLAEGELELATTALATWIDLQALPIAATESMPGGGLLGQTAKAWVERGAAARAAPLVAAAFDDALALARVARAGSPPLPEWIWLAPFSVFQDVVDGLCKAGRPDDASALVGQALAAQEAATDLDAESQEGVAAIVGLATWCLAETLRVAGRPAADTLGWLERAATVSHRIGRDELALGLVFLAHNLMGACGDDEPLRDAVWRIAERDLRSTRFREALRRASGDEAAAAHDEWLAAVDVDEAAAAAQREPSSSGGSASARKS